MSAPQGSPEWLAERMGKVTASRVADVLARTKSGASASRANYSAQLVCELLTGKPSESFTNAAMERGTELEPFARDAYCQHRGELVEQCGFLLHPTIADLGASPDGLVGADGLVEIKCPGAAAHIETLQSGIPSKYIAQVQTQMMVTGRAWCDFASFHPDFPDHLRLSVHRIDADPACHDLIETAVGEFMAEVRATVAKLQARAA